MQQVGRVVRQRLRQIAGRGVRRAHCDTLAACHQQLAPADAVGGVGVGELQRVRRTAELEPRSRGSAHPAASSRARPAPWGRRRAPSRAPAAPASRRPAAADAARRARRADRARAPSPQARCARPRSHRRAAAAGTSGSRPCRARSAPRRPSRATSRRVYWLTVKLPSGCASAAGTSTASATAASGEEAEDAKWHSPRVPLGRPRLMRAPSAAAARPGRRAGGSAACARAPS